MLKPYNKISKSISDKEFIEVCNNSISMAEASRKLNLPFMTFKARALSLNCYKASIKNSDGTYIPWNKGLTKNEHEAIARGSEAISNSYKHGRNKIFWKGKHLPNEIKEKISRSMKKAHNENRAYNIGMNRSNNKASYPEQFFMKVIENEFSDKEYVREYSFGKYSLDFAWLHKKKCIEIDGDQHYRTIEAINHDKIKDEFIKSNGWKILRIRWRDMFTYPKTYIQLAKNFILSD